MGGMLDEDEHGASVGLFVDLSICLSAQQLFHILTLQHFTHVTWFPYIGNCNVI